MRVEAVTSLQIESKLRSGDERVDVTDTAPARLPKWLSFPNSWRYSSRPPLAAPRNAQALCPGSGITPQHAHGSPLALSLQLPLFSPSWRRRKFALIGSVRCFFKNYPCSGALYRTR